MQRCARDRRVVFFEEPLYDVAEAEIELRGAGQVIIAVPHLAPHTPPEVTQRELRVMVEHVVERTFAAVPVLWYYAPGALAYTRELAARAVVYDCVDPTVVRGSPLLDEHAQMMLRRADVVFTRERGLWQHPFAFAPDAVGEAVWQDMWHHVERAALRRAAAGRVVRATAGGALAKVLAARRDD